MVRPSSLRLLVPGQLLVYRVASSLASLPWTGLSASSVQPLRVVNRMQEGEGKHVRSRMGPLTFAVGSASVIRQLRPPE